MTDPYPHRGSPRARAKLYFARGRWLSMPMFVLPSCRSSPSPACVVVDRGDRRRDGEYKTPDRARTVLSVASQHRKPAVEARGGGKLVQYVAPRAPDLAALFRVTAMVCGPWLQLILYGKDDRRAFPRRSGWYIFADGNPQWTLMLGVTVESP